MLTRLLFFLLGFDFRKRLYVLEILALLRSFYGTVVLFIKKPLLILVILTGTLFANEDMHYANSQDESLIQNINTQVEIDWTRGYVVARAQVALPVIRPDGKSDSGLIRVASSLSVAREMARDEALEEATGRLMRNILSLQLDSRSTIYEKMKRDLGLRERMGLVREFFKVQSRNTGEGRVSVELTLHFRGAQGLYSLLLDKQYNSEKVPQIDSEGFLDKISSIVIDMSEFRDFQPSLEPRVYSDNGRLIFGPEIVSGTCSIRYGIASWQTSDTVAKRHKRAGSYPYYIYAGGVLGAKKSDIFLHEKDVKRILSNVGGRKALRRCSVLFIVPNKGK